jgi:glycerol-1-phosphatase
VSLADAYDLVVFDLDGVIYLIDKPIEGAAEAVERLRSAGTAVAYATNNASRRAADVAAMLAERLPGGAPVLVVGAEALRAEVRDAGLTVVEAFEDKPAAVVQGYGPDVGWKILAEAALSVRAGALWMATNTDRTLPSPRGPLPGNGSLVAVLRTALDREPDVVVGKPAPALFTTAASLSHASRPLVVGDRLDTDIEGAVGAGMDSLLVLTGVSGPAELLTAPAQRRPTFVADDVSGLFQDEDSVRIPPKGTDELGGWRLSGGRLEGSGRPVDALRLLCPAAWDGVTVTAGSDEARSVLADWGLSR